MGVIEKTLNKCDIEIQLKYKMLDEMLQEIEEEICELIEEIERATIEEEVAENLRQVDFARAREDLLDANSRKATCKQRLNYLEEKYEFVFDKFDEVFVEVLDSVEPANVLDGFFG